MLGRNVYTVGMNAVVSVKGQVTIPKALRERLGIRPGQVLEFDEEHGRLVATKVQARGHIDGVFGILADGPSTDDLVAELRDPG